jgi:hypothetical protein
MILHPGLKPSLLKDSRFNLIPLLQVGTLTYVHFYIVVCNNKNNTNESITIAFEYRTLKTVYAVLSSFLLRHKR